MPAKKTKKKPAKKSPPRSKKQSPMDRLVELAGSALEAWLPALWFGRGLTVAITKEFYTQLKSETMPAFDADDLRVFDIFGQLVAHKAIPAILLEFAAHMRKNPLAPVQ